MDKETIKKAKKSFYGQPRLEANLLTYEFHPACLKCKNYSACKDKQYNAPNLLSFWCADFKEKK